MKTYNALAIVLMIIALLVTSSLPAIEPDETSEFRSTVWPDQHAKCRPVALTNVKVNGYLGKRIDRNLASLLLGMKSPIPEGFEAVAAGTNQPKYRLAADSDLYKWLEGACYVFARTNNQEIKKEIDRIAGLIMKCQHDDGYINTQVPPKKRWDPTVRHDLYIAGHFFEAVAAHHRATGERNLLDAAHMTPLERFLATRPEVELP